jgi:prevent-host-death family protein
MDRIGIREMRQNFSRYAERARRGESFVVTDRGREIARLVPAPTHASVGDRLIADRARGEERAPCSSCSSRLPSRFPVPG